jgi:hypothetical protein
MIKMTIISFMDVKALAKVTLVVTKHVQLHEHLQHAARLAIRPPNSPSSTSRSTLPEGTTLTD